MDIQLERGPRQGMKIVDANLPVTLLVPARPGIPYETIRPYPPGLELAEYKRDSQRPNVYVFVRHLLAPEL